MTRTGRSYQYDGRYSIPPQELGMGTWLEYEGFAYPRNTFTRRGLVQIRPNPNNPDLDLPYGETRIVYCRVADTYYSIPARLNTAKLGVVKGFVHTIQVRLNDGTYQDIWAFTPDCHQ